jgi:hypothetical protein
MLALAACIAVTGSIANAAPARRHGHHARVSKKAKHPKKRAPPVDDTASDSAGDRVAFASRDAEVDASVDTTARRDTSDDELVDAPPKRHRHAASGMHDWNIAIGPNVWASSVDATVTLGGKSVTTGVGFFDLEHHARYGIPLLAEARYRRFSLMADFMYGVIDVNGGKDVGPLMVTVDGSASSLQLDSYAGYRLVGDERSPLSLEARGGVRYQRTAVAASLGVNGSPVTSYAVVDGGIDALAGARVFLQPSSRFYVAGAVDIGLFGSSTTTWSAAADANVRVTSHVQVSLGWRTLTMDRSYMEMVMHGPRAAVQATF